MRQQIHSKQNAITGDQSRLGNAPHFLTESPSVQRLVQLKSELNRGSGVVQRTEGDAVDEANAQRVGTRFHNWGEVHSNKNRFSPEQWQEIVQAYNRGNSGGLRLRYTAPVPQQSAPQPSPSTPASSLPSSSTVLSSGLSVASDFVPGLGTAQALYGAATADNVPDALYAASDALLPVSNINQVRTQGSQALRDFRQGEIRSSLWNTVGAVGNSLLTGLGLGGTGSVIANATESKPAKKKDDSDLKKEEEH